MKDRLGSLRATVQAGHMMLREDFNSNLSQWRITAGDWFIIANGRLVNERDGEQMVIDRASRVLTDGILTVDVRFSDVVPTLDNPEQEPDA